MKWKNKLILSFFLWGLILLLASPISLNEKPWFAVLAVVVSFVVVFGWKKIYGFVQKLRNRS